MKESYDLPRRMSIGLRSEWVTGTLSRPTLGLILGGRYNQIVSERRRDMIDVHDLPAAMADAIARNVEALRQELKKNGKPPGPLGTWPLGSNPPLSRDEIYGDRLDAKLNAQRD